MDHNNQENVGHFRFLADEWKVNDLNMRRWTRFKTHTVRVYIYLAYVLKLLD